MKTFREYLAEAKVEEDINEGVRGSSLTDKDFKEFSKLLTERVKWIKDLLKDGHVGDVAGYTESFSNDLSRWVEKLKKSDMR